MKNKTKFVYILVIMFFCCYYNLAFAQSDISVDSFEDIDYSDESLNKTDEELAEHAKEVEEYFAEAERKANENTVNKSKWRVENNDLNENIAESNNILDNQNDDIKKFSNDIAYINKMMLVLYGIVVIEFLLIVIIFSKLYKIRK